MLTGTLTHFDSRACVSLMTPEEQKAALNRARILENYAKAQKKVLRSVTPEEQKAALSRAKILENYGKAVEEAFATMKK